MFVPPSGAEQCLELGRHHGLELGVGARLRRPVGPPAEEVGRVPEAGALQVIVADLDHALDAQGLPGEVLLVVPPARGARHALLGLAGHRRPLLPGVGLERSLAERRELGLELLPLRRRETRADAHVVERPLLVVEPEEERADTTTALEPAEARHHAAVSYTHLPSPRD